MKKHKLSRALAVLLSLAMIVGLAQSMVFSQDPAWTYDPENGTLTDGSLVLKNVTDDGEGNITIGDNSNSNFTELDLTGTVEDDAGAVYRITVLGENAFNNCSDLTAVMFPDTLTEIGESAFRGCRQLTNITLPASLSVIGYRAFYDAYDLKTITLLSDTPPSIGSNAFETNSVTSIYVPEGSEAAYRADEGWKKYLIILPEVAPSGLWVNGADIIGGETAEGVDYDAETGTLTLNDAYLDTPNLSGGDGSSIYSVGGDLTVVLNGNSTVGGTECLAGIYVCDGSLTVTGDGTLVTEGSELGIYAEGRISVDGSVTNLTASGGSSALYSYFNYITVAESHFYKHCTEIIIEKGIVTHRAVRLDELWVNDVDILNGGTVPGVSFDSETNTLTLENAVIDTPCTAGYDDGIYASGDINIVLKGDNIISGDGIEYGINVDPGSVTIAGDGTLVTEGSELGIYAEGRISVDGSVTKLTASGDSSALYSDDNDITVGEDPYFGEYKNYKNIIIENGIVTHMFSPLDELWVNNVDILNGGTVPGVSFDSETNTLTLENAVIDTPCTAGYDDGIYASGDINIVLKGDNIISGDGIEYGIAADPGSITITGDGTLVTEGSYNGIYVESSLAIIGCSVTAVSPDDAIYTSNSLIVSPAEGELIFVYAGDDEESAKAVNGSPFADPTDITTRFSNAGYFRCVSGTLSAVTPEIWTYDKNCFIDTVFTITCPENVTPVDVYVDGNKLTENTDYVISESKVRFTESYEKYLSGLSGNRTLTVTFEMSDGSELTAGLIIPDTYSVTILSDPEHGGYWFANGYSNMESVCYVVKGEEVELHAAEMYGYEFVCWKSGDQVVSEDEYYTFTPDSDCSLTMVLRKLSNSIELSPSDPDFGIAKPGYEQAPDAQTITVTNTGEMELIIVRPESEYYEINGEFSFALEPGDSMTFTVRPKDGLAVGNYDETISVYGLINTIQPRSVEDEQRMPEDMYTVAELNAFFSVGELYTLTFETNGGSAVESITAIEGSVIELGDHVSERDGFTFSGWYADSGITEKLTSLTLDGNKTVYAGWTEGSDTSEPSDSSAAPDTGDSGNIALLIAVLSVSGAGMLGTVYGRKRKTR